MSQAEKGLRELPPKNAKKDLDRPFFDLFVLPAGRADLVIDRDASRFAPMRQQAMSGSGRHRQKREKDAE